MFHNSMQNLPLYGCLMACLLGVLHLSLKGRFNTHLDTRAAIRFRVDTFQIWNHVVRFDEM